ncbi:T9SS type B sorting domain-containing protein [Psychroflexus gondwanensis]|uniref:T9SS type B sorting domain-containing protein n=1 Tax=Psychroflexus gondwanensis TaxID=251 RepID=UPI001CC1F540|nr:T9SS type B sorting domain-containing protein [Psychroflexus gondwanensis]
MNKVIISIFLLSFWGALAQGEANNWYFGFNAGISFNTNPPTALTNGQLSTNEGCSSISDANGNLLMYTDGRTIWNRNHQIMSNADYFNGTGLNGDPSSTSSGLIVPHPTNPNLYFVFTIDEPHHENANAYPSRGPADRNGNSIPLYTDTNQGVPEADDGFNNGLNYSVVDLSLGGGLGNVIPSERNKELITYDPSDSEQVKYKASEKITAVRGRDCNSVWVITHFRNKFYTFFIDQAGIDETPEISEVPPLLEVDNYRRAAIGYLKASPLGDKLLIAHNTTNFDQSGTQDAGDGNVYIYDFDNLTGTVSNPLELIAGVNAYGVEFSQDGTKAYATVDDTSDKIYQWDLNSTDIPNSITSITNLSLLRTALQLGPDGKIYHSIINTSTLGVINNPNELGTASNYSQSSSQGAISLNGRIATFGLPPFIQSLFNKRIPIVDTPTDEVIEQVRLCDIYSYTLSYDDIPGASYVWKKDGIILPGETENFLDITVPLNSIFPLQENYSLEVDLNTGDCPLIGVARITFNKSPEYNDTELIACKEVQEDFATFDLTEIKTILADDAQVDPNEINLIFYRRFEDAELENNPIPTSPSFINSEGLESLFAKAITFGVCTSIVEVELTIQEFPDVNLDDELVIYCMEDFPNPTTIKPLDENEDPSLYQYLWSTGETSPFLEINSAGEYSVNIRFVGEDCPVTKIFNVEESLPTFNSETINLCDTYQYTIEMNEFNQASFSWFENGTLIPNETSSSLTISIPEDTAFPVSNTYILEVDLEDGSCLKTWEYNVDFNFSPDYNSVELETCKDFDLGYGIFNLTSSIDLLVDGVSGISSNNIDITFYEFESDAINGLNEISNPQNFENRNNLNRIYAVITGFESCETLVEIGLFTFDFPSINIENEFLTYCLEDFPNPIVIDALSGNQNLSNYQFLWSTDETSQTLEINQAGAYSVEIIDSNSGCSLIKEFEVIESNLADFEVNVEDSSRDNKSIEITLNPSSLGIYEYALNEPINFQESNRFENLNPGIYTVYVRDQLGCGISQKTVSVLGIMEFFTPNGDGINDIWKISGLSGTNQENIQLAVYDRYGKLLSSFTSKDRGWDGTYNGENMPTDDYWFRIQFSDGRVETGNFTLKR